MQKVLFIQKIFNRVIRFMDRKNIAVKSSIVGLISKVVTILLAFICRKLFLQYLGSELLGINSTLTQILDTLSLGELGFQTAIIFLLYEPLVYDNKEKVSQIIMLLKRIYNVVGGLIFIVGLLVMPFLSKIITNVETEISVINIVYIIMLLGTSLSYFLSYNKALFQADQKIYIVYIIDLLLQILTTILKLIAIIVFKSFIFYVVIGMLYNVLSNLISYIFYRKIYCWIDRKARADNHLFKKLFSNIKEIFCGKIAGYIFSSTDNLVISAFVGTNWVGYVGNYSTIISAVKMVIYGFTGSIQPMLGNLLVKGSKADTEKVLLNYGFVRFSIVVFLLIPAMCLSDMFVNLFYGEKYVLDSMIVILLAADVFIISLQGAIGEFIDALGYFAREKLLYIVCAIVNIVFSCTGAVLLGIVPVFLATVLSQIIGWIWRSIIAYKYYFKTSHGWVNYWRIQIGYIVYIVINVLIVNGVMNFIKLPINYIGFLLYGIIIEAILLVLFYFCFRKNEEFFYLMKLVKKLFQIKRI